MIYVYISTLGMYVYLCPHAIYLYNACIQYAFYICIAVHGFFIFVKIGIDLEQYRARIGCARITTVNLSQGKCHRGESFLTLDFYLMAFYLCILVYLLPILLRPHVCIPSSLKLNPKLTGYFIIRTYI